MLLFLQQYVDWGLADIVFVSGGETEVESGYNLEITCETVVARKGQGFVEVVARKEGFVCASRWGCEHREGF